MLAGMMSSINHWRAVSTRPVSMNQQSTKSDSPPNTISSTSVL